MTQLCKVRNREPIANMPCTAQDREDVACTLQAKDADYIECKVTVGPRFKSKTIIASCKCVTVIMKQGAQISSGKLVKVRTGRRRATTNTLVNTRQPVQRTSEVRHATYRRSNYQSDCCCPCPHAAEAEKIIRRRDSSRVSFRG
jgi:hypothetical protein